MSCIIVVNIAIILKPRHIYPVDTSLRVYSAEELKLFDGTQLGKPIYLGFEGLVYDVSKGAEYYAVSGTYHYLAGRDATNELHVAGGAIIKAKYPVIGRLY